MPYDSPELRSNLVACLPSLVIEDVAAESGQRVVYFGHFEDQLIPSDIYNRFIDDSEGEEDQFLRDWEKWGRVVVKVVGDASVDALSRLQAETAILNELRPVNFPALLYSNLFVDNPVTDERLPGRLYVSIRIANALLPLWMTC